MEIDIENNTLYIELTDKEAITIMLALSWAIVEKAGNNGFDKSLLNHGIDPQILGNLYEDMYWNNELIEIKNEMKTVQ